MPARLELYRVFREVAESGSVSAAARSLYVSQSAVSQSIRQLEQQLQTRLFERSSRGVSLTADGKLLYEYVSKAIDLIGSGEEKLSKARALELGHLAIGASDTLTRRYLLPYLKTFHDAYPAVGLEIRNGTSQGVLDLLHAGRVDLAFSSKPADPELFESRRCFDTHYIFVAAPDYPCDFAREYALRELAAMPLILLDHKASSRDFLEKFFLQNGLELRPAFELGTHDLQLALARIGLGVAGVTEEFSRSSLDRGVLRRVRVTPEPPARSVQVCTLRGVAPTEAARRFVDLLREKG